MYIKRIMFVNNDTLTGGVNLLDKEGVALLPSSTTVSEIFKIYM